LSLELSLACEWEAARQAHQDHVVGWVVWQASHHFSYKIHLSHCNHLSYAGADVELLLLFAVVDAFFLCFCYQDLEDPLNASVKEHLKLEEMQFQVSAPH
jgi:hypothetical protein